MGPLRNASATIAFASLAISRRRESMLMIAVPLWAIVAHLALRWTHEMLVAPAGLSGEEIEKIVIRFCRGEELPGQLRG